MGMPEYPDVDWGMRMLIGLCVLAGIAIGVVGVGSFAWLAKHLSIGWN